MYLGAPMFGAYILMSVKSSFYIDHFAISVPLYLYFRSGQISRSVVSNS